MSLSTRLQKLVPSLTPKQRILLILRARAAGKEPDGELLRMDDPGDRREYDSYIALLIAANNELVCLLRTIALRVDGLEQACYPMRVNEEAAELIEAEAALERAPATKNWRKRGAPILVNAFLRGVAEEQRQHLLSEALERWQELGALEAVWREVADQFDGADPLGPEHRSLVDETAERLRKLVAELAGREKKAPAPSEELVEMVRGHIEQAVSYLGLVDRQQ